MSDDLIKRLDDLHKAATPGKLETAEFKEGPDWFSCPHCNGEGEVDAVQYVNYDGVAANVLFSGIGHKFGANEDWYLAVSRDWPAVADALTAAQEENERLVHDIERLSASLSAEVTGSEKLREALEWYGEQTRLYRLVHGGGDTGRNALAADGGQRARTALNETPNRRNDND